MSSPPITTQQIVGRNSAGAVLIEPDFQIRLEQLRQYLTVSRLVFQGVAPLAASLIATSTHGGEITAASVVNSGAGAVTLSAWLAMDGGAMSASNKIYEALSVPAGSQAALSLLVGQAWPKGAKLYFEASSALALTVSAR
jgi:hypothetical protein